MNKTLTTVVIAVALLSGCSATFTNRLACARGGDTAFVVSLYGPIGVASAIDSRDVDCKKVK